MWIDYFTKYLTKESITIVRGGSEIYSDIEEKIINLPEFIPTEVELETLTALIHESGHILLTKDEKGIFVGDRLRDREYRQQTFFCILNIVEDIRINFYFDKKFSRYMVGVKNLFEKLWKLKENHIAGSLKSDPFGSIVIMMINYTYGLKGFEGKFNQQAKKIWDANGSEIKKRINKIKENCITMTFEEVVVEAVEIYKILVDNGLLMELYKINKEKSELKGLDELYDERLNEIKQVEEQKQKISEELQKEFEKELAKELKEIQKLDKEQKEALKKELEEVLKEIDVKGEGVGIPQPFEKELEREPTEQEKVSRTEQEAVISEIKKTMLGIKQDFEREKEKIEKNLEKKLKDIDNKIEEKEGNTYEVMKDVRANLELAMKEIKVGQTEAVDDILNTFKGVEPLLMKRGIVGKGLTEIKNAFNNVFKETIKDFKLFEKIVDFKKVFYEFLLKKKTELIHSETGLIDRKKLSRYYSGDIFEEKAEKTKIDTAIYFYLDTSASMNDEFSFMRKITILIKLVKDLLEVIFELGLKGKIKICIKNFSNKVENLITFEEYENLEPKQILERIDRLFPSGGTDAIKVVEDIEKTNFDTRIKNIILMITDAEFFEAHKKKLTELRETIERPNLIFEIIGIGVSLTEENKKLFREKIATSATMLGEIVYTQLMERIM